MRTASYSGLTDRARVHSADAPLPATQSGEMDQLLPGLIFSRVAICPVCPHCIPFVISMSSLRPICHLYVPFAFTVSHLSSLCPVCRSSLCTALLLLFIGISTVSFVPSHICLRSISSRTYPHSCQNDVILYDVILDDITYHHNFPHSAHCIPHHNFCCDATFFVSIYLFHEKTLYITLHNYLHCIKNSCGCC